MKRHFILLWWLALIALVAALPLVAIHESVSTQEAAQAAIERASQPTARMVACADIKDAETRADDWFCSIRSSASREADFAVIGDSHSAGLIHAWEAAATRSGRSGLLSSRSGCPPLLDVFPTSRTRTDALRCQALNRRLFEFIRIHRITDVFLVAKWSYYTEPWGPNYINAISLRSDERATPSSTRIAFRQGVRQTANAYRQAGIRLHIIEQVPQQLKGPAAIYADALTDPSKTIERLRALSVQRVEHERLQAFVRSVFASEAAPAGVSVINVDSDFCDDTACLPPASE